MRGESVRPLVKSYSALALKGSRTEAPLGWQGKRAGEGERRLVWYAPPTSASSAQGSSAFALQCYEVVWQRAKKVKRTGQVGGGGEESRESRRRISPLSRGAVLVPKKHDEMAVFPSFVGRKANRAES